MEISLDKYTVRYIPAIYLHKRLILPTYSVIRQAVSEIARLSSYAAITPHACHYHNTRDLDACRYYAERR